MEDLDKQLAETLGLELVNDARFLSAFPKGVWIHVQDDEGCDSMETFSPSTNIGRAMTLLEGLDWTLEKYWPDAQYRCSIGRKVESCCFECCGGCHEFKATADAETPAEAISRAFLSYKNKEKDRNGL